MLSTEFAMPGAAHAWAEEAHLWRRWHQAQDVQARDALMTLHMPYARVLAAKAYARRSHDVVEFDEYLQFANVALIESIERYDSALGVQFRTFAHRRIRGAILNGLELLSEQQQQISVQQRLKASRLKSARLDSAGYAHASGSSEVNDCFLALAEAGLGYALLTLSDGAMVQGDNTPPIADTAFSSAELKQFSRRLDAYLGRLTVRESQVIKAHYLHAEALRDIAKKLGLSNARVTQLHRQGLKRLRDLLANCDLLDGRW